MALSIENIKFIDNYLKHDIEYIDVRTEMVDHVASEIEEQMCAGDKRSFYYIFKDYMVENKTRLINDDKKFRKIIDKRIFISLRENLLKPVSIIVLVLSYIILSSKIFNNYFSIDHKNFNQFLMIFTALIYFVIVFKLKKKRYSAIERSSLMFCALFYLTDLGFFFISISLNKLLNINTEIINSFFASLTFALVTSSIYTTIQFKNEYNNRFEKVSLT